jgi:hypothetical protein
MTGGAGLADRNVQTVQGEMESADDLLNALTAAFLALTGQDGELVRKRALRDSLVLARRGLDAGKALLLHVESHEPLRLVMLYSTGLSQEQIDACRELRSCDGVSPSIIRRVIETREVAYIRGARRTGRDAAKASLAGAAHSVLCAPILDSTTGAVLAILYFQNPGVRPFEPWHWNGLTAYATALSQGIGMHLSAERRLAASEAERVQSTQGVEAPELVGEREATQRLRQRLDEEIIPDVPSM